MQIVLFFWGCLTGIVKAPSQNIIKIDWRWASFFPTLSLLPPLLICDQTFLMKLYFCWRIYTRLWERAKNRCCLWRISLILKSQWCQKWDHPALSEEPGARCPSQQWPPRPHLCPAGWEQTLSGLQRGPNLRTRLIPALVRKSAWESRLRHRGDQKTALQSRVSDIKILWIAVIKTGSFPSTSLQYSIRSW